jgi:S-adenosylmethionine decarboxylase proenzyme
MGLHKVASEMTVAVDCETPLASGFEGVEKRLELEFCATGEGLRALSRAQLDGFLAVAQCSIVSETHSLPFDAYVLSESSLFIYPAKLIIKTCGTTALLTAMPSILALAASIGATPRRCRFTRSCFKYPAEQPAPHRSWAEECAFLDAHFPGTPGTACVLGTPGSGLLWHVYCADVTPLQPRSLASVSCALNGSSEAATLTLEVCMTRLDDSSAADFMFGDQAPPAAQVTSTTGIRRMFKAAVIDDFVFSPCGYSMNALQAAGLATIHVTPEARCSYASVEVSGHEASAYTPEQVVADSVAIFQPGRISVALTVDQHDMATQSVPFSWAKLPSVAGYKRSSLSSMPLPGGGLVIFGQYELGESAFSL